MVRTLLASMLLATCVWGRELVAQETPPGIKNIPAGIQQSPAVTLTEVQRLRARVLQLEDETAALRRTLLALQGQIAQCRAPIDQAARDQAWTALEATLGLGCHLDRATLAARCDGPRPPADK